MAEVTLVEAITLALARAMDEDPNVVVLGEDVGVNGGVFRATAGLQQRFGADRVIDTPLAELLISGLCVGMTYPSRDMLVRAVTPPNAYGRVFGFVSMGFNIGASIAPIIYGAMMDHGEPLAVFMLSAAVCIICISTVTFGFSRREVH